MIDPDRPRILVVEDDEGNKDCMCHMFQSPPFNCQVVSAGTVNEAIPHLDTRIDLIVLDLMLPHRNGIELIEHVRRVGLAPRIIVFTGRIGVEVNAPVRALLKPGDKFVVKMHYDDLMQCVREIRAEWQRRQPS